MLSKPLRNENGFVLVLAMAMLVVLTLIGLSGTRSSVTELKISGNERDMTQEFYVADSVWQVGALWLNYLPGVPDSVNITRRPGDLDSAYDTAQYYRIVRNYGDGIDGTLNNTFPSGTQDGILGGYNFWYRLTMDDGTFPEGFDGKYEDIPTEIDANSAGRTQITTRIYKVLKVGYN